MSDPTESEYLAVRVRASGPSADQGPEQTGRPHYTQARIAPFTLAVPGVVH